MELDERRFREKITPAKWEDIEQLIDKAMKEVDNEAFGEIKKVLDRTFGEENNQIVRPTVQNIVSRIYNHVANNFSTLNKSTTAGIESYLRELGFFQILIRFPEINIVNDDHDSHTIRDLFIRIGLHPDGRLATMFEGMRTTLTTAEVSAGYFHSHMEAFCADEFHWATEPTGNTIETGTGTLFWEYFCTNGGPVSQTNLQAKAKYNANLFQLFCLNLKNYVAWESLEGVPYIHMRSIREHADGVQSRQPHRAISVVNSIPIGKKLAEIVLSDVEKYGIMECKPFAVGDNGITTLDSDLLRLKLAKAIVENRDELFIGRQQVFQDFLVAHHGGMSVVPIQFGGTTAQSQSSHVADSFARRVSRTLFTFKGNPIKLTIFKEDQKTRDNEEETLYAHPSVVSVFLAEASRLLTEKAREIRLLELAQSAS